MTRRILSPTMAMLLATLAASPAPAQQDTRSVKPAEPALKVIEEKCLICHNKDRIDAAIKERRDMDKILRQMEKKGVTLTEKERQVMGHFQFERPLKGEAMPPEKKGDGFFK